MLARIATHLLLALSGLAHAQSVPLNDTGQTRCYDLNQTVIACDEANVGDSGILPHQDARYGRDAAHVLGQLPKLGSGAAGFDFSCVLWDGTIIDSPDCHVGLVANLGNSPSGSPATDWACTRDNVTGMVWSLRTPDLVDWHVATSADFTALGHNAASRCGLSAGWRAPSRHELLGLLDFDRASGAMMDLARLPGLAGVANCWGAEPVAVAPGNPEIEAGLVSFSNGRVSRVPKDGMGFTFGCLVHGAMAPTSPSFTIHPDGTATDNGTGLMWDRCLESAGGAPTGPGLCDFLPLMFATNDRPSAATLLQVVSARNAANHRGYNDWRLPNLKELDSVVDLSLPTNPETESGTVMNTTVFPLGDWNHAKRSMVSATQTDQTLDGTLYYWLDPLFGGVIGVGEGGPAGWTVGLRMVRGGHPPADFDLINDRPNEIFANGFE